jgi:hypothetical protein
MSKNIYRQSDDTAVKKILVYYLKYAGKKIDNLFHIYHSE